ncbi:hypothetical protein [Streptomyces clavuligerus]|uniref:hypothetical protein n=2 Tax=Streptomyces clavuligerus TaxID=1901 RepID=UPI00018520BD|nr:hypothetical protein [Streptomyces clavuligerus]WDN55709.1 hypothetical protein LL058_27825 [Streptomyces clavuligerus]
MTMTTTALCGAGLDGLVCDDPAGHWGPHRAGGAREWMEWARVECYTMAPDMAVPCLLAAGHAGPHAGRAWRAEDRAAGGTRVEWVLRDTVSTWMPGVPYPAENAPV